MSAFGPKQTSSVAPHMSAFGVRADMTCCDANVCFWPKADIPFAATEMSARNGHRRRSRG